MLQRRVSRKASRPNEMRGTVSDPVRVDTSRYRILMLISDTGGGHRASADALAAAIHDMYPNLCIVSILDIWTDYGVWPFNTFVPAYRYLCKTPSYWSLLYDSTKNHFSRDFINASGYALCAAGFRKVFKNFKPHLVCSVHPLCQHVPLKLLDELCPGPKIPSFLLTFSSNNHNPSGSGKLLMRSATDVTNSSETVSHFLPIRRFNMFSVFSHQPDTLITKRSDHLSRRRASYSSVGASRQRRVPFVTIVTDLGGAHPLWFSPDVDLCFVPSHPVREAALAEGLTSSQIRMYGLPIRKEFWRAETQSREQRRRSLGLEPKRPTVLLVGGGDGVGNLDVLTTNLIHELTHFSTSLPPLQLVVICGNNKEAKQALEQRFADCLILSCEETNVSNGDAAQNILNAKELVLSSEGQYATLEGNVEKLFKHRFKPDKILSKSCPELSCLISASVSYEPSLYDNSSSTSSSPLQYSRSAPGTLIEKKTLQLPVRIDSALFKRFSLDTFPLSAQNPPCCSTLLRKSKNDRRDSTSLSPKNWTYRFSASDTDDAMLESRKDDRQLTLPTLPIVSADKVAAVDGKHCKDKVKPVGTPDSAGSTDRDSSYPPKATTPSTIYEDVSPLNRRKSDSNSDSLMSPSEKLSHSSSKKLNHSPCRENPASLASAATLSSSPSPSQETRTALTRRERGQQTARHLHSYDYQTLRHHWTSALSVRRSAQNENVSKPGKQDLNGSNVGWLDTFSQWWSAPKTAPVVAAEKNDSSTSAVSKKNQETEQHDINKPLLETDKVRGDCLIKLKVLPFVTNMADWMGAADILVTKAGPGTIAEGCTRGLPILLYCYLPGQEEGNVTFVKDNKIGAYSKSPRVLARAIRALLTRPESLTAVSARASQVVDVQATRRIASDIINVMLSYQRCNLINCS